MTEKRKYPIAGTDFFTQIMDDDGYYIDKTDVIPWIFCRKKRVILFTRPRRFGKSTMISMLKAFFEYRLDRAGKPVDNRHYFETLMVSQDAEAMAQLGAFPVIWITLKDVIQSNYEKATDEEKSRIRAQLLALRDVALQQIDEQQYVEEFRERHTDVKTILCYGLAFCRRWVEIAMKA